VQSLEILLSHLKTDLEQAERRTNILGQNLRHSQEGYELKSRYVSIGRDIRRKERKEGTRRNRKRKRKIT
jgi:hypothetical protein